MAIIPTWLVTSVTALAPSLAWREIGGPAIAFTFLRTFIFGKQLRSVEYPYGDLKTINVRLATVNAIKKQIAQANGFTDIRDIKQLHRYEDNFWTEQLLTPKDIRSLNDNNWILWSRSYTAIPTKNVNMKELNSLDNLKKNMGGIGSILDEGDEDFVLKTAAAAVNEGTSHIVDTMVDKTSVGGAAMTEGATTTASGAHPSHAPSKEKGSAADIYSDRYKISLNAVKITAMNYVSQCRHDSFFPDGVEGGPLTEREYQILIDLLLDEDSYLISLYHNFKDDPKLFVKYARKKAQDFIRREKEKKDLKEAIASKKPLEEVFAGPAMQWDSMSEEARRKTKMTNLISEYKTGKSLVEDIIHPESTQNDKTREKEQQSTQTAQVTTSI